MTAGWPVFSSFSSIREKDNTQTKGSGISMMTPERWEQIGALYDQILSTPTAQRAALLDHACADDPDLRREVESMLAAYEADPDFLEQPAVPALDAAAMPGATFETETTMGPYRLVRLLGRGGMGDVYLAVREFEAARQSVAVKLLRPGLEQSDLAHRFAAEQQILAGLVHPGIARLLDAGQTDDGRPYLAMEYVDGEPITTYCDRHQLSIEQRLRLFIHVCKAVQYAHQHLVIHRDLKPSNILVAAPATGRPEEGTVKLLDFGIAKMLEPLDAETSLFQTQTGHRLLTPAYASPEQVAGAAVTTTSDIYSLGVVLYELLAGRRPFALEGKTTSEIARIIAEQIPTRPSTAITQSDTENDDVDPSRARRSSTERLQRRLKGDLDTIALKALRKEPERRYSSAAELAEDLERHLAGLPVRARPDTAGYRLRKFARRHWAGVAAAVAFVVLLVSFAVAMTLQQTETARQRDRAEQELARAETVTDFLMDLFEANRPSEARGDTITARELLERGLERMEALEEQPEVQTRMLLLVGRIYRSLGEYDKATPLMERALAERRRFLGPNHEDVATSLFHLATLRMDQGRFEEATQLAHEALALHRALLGDQHAAVATDLYLLATLEKHLGNYDEAERRFLELLPIERQIYDANDPRLGRTLHNFGRLLSAKADYENAAIRFREALTLYQQAHGPDHPDVIVIMNSLGLTLSRNGQHEEAERMLEKVVTLRRKVLGPVHPGVATSLSALAIVFSAQDKIAEALEHLAEAARIYREALGDEHPNVATMTYNMARLLHKDGKLDAAEAKYREALAMRRKLLGDDHPRVAMNAAFLAHLLDEQGAYAAAEPLYLEATATLRNRLGADHAWTLDNQQRLIALYEAWGKPGKADAQRALLPPDTSATSEQ